MSRLSFLIITGRHIVLGEEARSNHLNQGSLCLRRDRTAGACQLLLYVMTQRSHSSGLSDDADGSGCCIVSGLDGGAGTARVQTSLRRHSLLWAPIICISCSLESWQGTARTSLVSHLSFVLHLAFPYEFTPYPSVSIRHLDPAHVCVSTHVAL